jgi:type IV secretory pathway VirB2 component (pilin)
MNKSELKSIFFLLLLAAAVPLFSQNIVPQGMITLTESLIEVFTGPIVTAILVLALIGTAIMYGVNKDNDRLKKGLIAVAISIGLIVGAQVIVGAIWRAAG